MPIMIPINIQDIPTIPVFNMDEFMSRVSRYASELWDTMTQEEHAKFSRRKSLSDDELTIALAGCPSYDAVTHDDMSQLTKDDYHRFALQHNTMKGIEKWL